MSISESNAADSPSNTADWLAVGDGHRLWWTARGDAARPTVLVLHGGPGGSTREPTLRWWQGQPVGVIAFDQRGCGRSEPRGGLRGNTLAALVTDVEALRIARGVERWALAGGSWGARLALAYAAAHPQCVSGLYLRSPFLGSLPETRRYVEPWLGWLGDDGRAWVGEARAHALRQLYCGELEWPDADPQFASIENEPAQRVLPALLDDVRLARAWSAFDEAQSRPGGVARGGSGFKVPSDAVEMEGGSEPLPQPEETAKADAQTLASWRIHATHALAHWGSADPETGAWPDAVALANAWSGPVSVVAGADDACCDPVLAQALAALFPGAGLQLVPGAGHSLEGALLAPVLAAEAQAFGQRLLGAPP